MAEQAVSALDKTTDHGLADEVLEEAARQCPRAVHPHLDVLFRRNAGPGWPRYRKERRRAASLRIR